MGKENGSKDVGKVSRVNELKEANEANGSYEVIKKLMYLGEKIQQIQNNLVGGTLAELPLDDFEVITSLTPGEAQAVLQLSNAEMARLLNIGLSTWKRWKKGQNITNSSKRLITLLVYVNVVDYALFEDFKFCLKELGKRHESTM